MTRSTTRTAGSANLPLATIPLAAAIETLAQWYRCRRDARHLAELSDHHLKDIGISRGSITAAVEGRLR